jgi:hypothetical protein
VSFNQAFKSGTLVYQAGTNIVPYGPGGVLDTLRSFVVGTAVAAEVIDNTPDGNITSFSGTLAHFPCGLGRLTITYTIGTVDFKATDDGSGNIVDEDPTGSLTTGTISYEDGDWALVFSTAPDAGSDIKAKYIYGEPGRDWEELLYRNTTNMDGTDAGFGGGCKELIIRNTGKTGQENVIIGFREFYYDGGSSGGLNFNCYVYFPSSAPTSWLYNAVELGFVTYQATWKTYQKLPSIPLQHRGTTSYFIYSNRQRIVLVIKNGSNYESGYLGFGRRFGSPSQYPYPLVNKGSQLYTTSFTSHASTTSDWRKYIPFSYVSNSEGHATIIVSPANQYLFASGQDMEVSLEPRTQFVTTPGTLVGSPSKNAMLTYPVYVAGKTTVFMDLDGVYGAAGSSLQSEDTIDISNRRCTVFNNIASSVYNDFMAIEREEITTTSSSSSSTTS